MSKPNTTLAVLSVLAFSCVPAVAATISPDELHIGLFGGSSVGPGQYQFTTGSVALLSVRGAPNDVIWCFAAAHDASGASDTANLVTLFLEQPRLGDLIGFFEIPPQLAGMTFDVQALALSVEGAIKSSDVLIVTVIDSKRATEPAEPVKPLLDE
jgi:hypothetical protein